MSTDQNPAPGATAAPVSPVAVPPRRGRRWLVAALLGPLLLLALALALVLSSLHTEAGTRWWLAQLVSRTSGVEVRGVQGALLGGEGRFAVELLRIEAGGARVTLNGLAWQGLRLADWRRTAPFVDLHFDQLRAQALDIVPPPPQPNAPPLAAPTSLALPLTLHVDALQIDRLTIAGLPAPIEQLRARIELGAVHRISGLSLRWRGLALDANASLGAAAPLPLDASWALRAAPEVADAPDRPAKAGAPAAGLLPEWAKGLATSLHASGPLAGFEAQVALALQGQRLDASGRVTPFEKLPLARLDSRFEQLDLQPLAALAGAEAPTTRLDGQIKLQLDGDAALAIDAQLRNALPGAWDSGRLPLAELALVAAGSGKQWKVQQASAQLAGRNGAPAGRVTLDADLVVAALPTGQARLRLDAVDLALLDARAPPLRLSGPLQLRHRHTATATASTNANATATASTTATANATTKTTADAPFGELRLEVDLTGTLTGAAAKRAPAALRQAPVRIEATADLSARRLDVSRLRAVAGASSLQGTLQFREADGLWAGDGRLALARFDASQWLPGAPQAAWRQARNELNGTINLQGRAPLPGADFAAWLERLQASVDATLGDDSRLAGVPLSASAELRADGRGGIAGRARAAAADNRASVSINLQTGRNPGTAQEEKFDLEIDAPQLHRAAALGQLFGIEDLSGNAHLHTESFGGLSAWLVPGSAGARGGAAAALRTRGVVDIGSLRAAGVRLDRLHGRWNATLPPPPARGALTDAIGQSAIGADLRAEKLQVPGLEMPALALRVDGTLAAHRAALRAIVLPAVPKDPEANANTREAERLPRVVDIELDGRWRAEDGDRQHWQARLSQLLVQTLSRAQAAELTPALLAPKPVAQPAPGAASPAVPDQLLPAWSALKPAAPLLLARDMALDVMADPKGLSWNVEPGRAELAGAALNWRALRGQHVAGAAPTVDAELDLEPFLLVELLRRVRPDIAWSGDLRIGGRLDLHASQQQMKLDLQLARTGGDLELSEFGSKTALGLSEVLLSVSAEGGRWRLVQRLAGSNLGRIDSEINIQAEPQALFPGPDATLDGRLDAQVESLSGWAAWVPAGWRLAGRLDAGLQLAGRVGAPNVKGAVSGRELGLRNALVGVQLSEGTLDLALEGETATLNTLRFKAGEGTIEARGTSRLGNDPKSQIEVSVRKATVLGRVDRRVVLSGDAVARLAPGLLGLRGKFTVDEGLIDISQADAPQLGDDVTVVRGGIAADDTANAPPPPDAGRNTELDLVINLGERLRLQGRGLRTKLVGELRLTTPKGVLRADGEIRTDGGMYEAFSQRLEIDRGVITFVGDIGNPRLDIEAIRPNLDTRVGARITGTARAPRVRLFSEPEMSDIEKLALLITGRPYDNLGGTDALIMQRAALALLGGESGGGGVAGALRLDEFSIRQSDGATRETIIGVGKQISDRLYVGVETGLSQSGGAVQLTYRIGRRFTLRASGGTTSALDLIWLFRWD